MYSSKGVVVVVRRICYLDRVLQKTGFPLGLSICSPAKDAEQQTWPSTSPH
jgi:hypothetical protein